MRKIFLAIFILFSLIANGKGKVLIGSGFDVNPNAGFLCFRNWYNKTGGFEIGFGPSANFEDFVFNDMAVQGKYFYAFKSEYNYYRTYLGLMGKFTFIQDPYFHKNLPAGGIILGNEWFLGRFRNQGIAIEGGLLYGRISRQQYVEGSNVSITRYYKEFPLHLAFSYKFYFR
jgi:hypothetical protein